MIYKGYEVRTISFFNNKGGVGKITLSTNVTNYCTQAALAIVHS